MGYGLPQILEKLKCFKPQLIKFMLQGEKREARSRTKVIFVKY